MQFPTRALLAAALFASALPAFGAGEWVRLTTPHFEIYTTAGEKKGREAILYFEQVRSFVTEITHANWDQPVPVRIIAFKSDKQFRPYAPNGSDFAYYAGTQSRDYIVMEDIDAEHFPVAIHEYMHLVIRHSGIKLPTWLNEGWADVFSTLRPMGKDATIGEALPGHIQTLQSEKWLDFNTLTTVNEKSPNYNEKTRVGVFYAESWALAHMLYLGPGYHEKFSKFLALLNDGKTAAEACQIAYGRTPEKVFSDLRSYLSQHSLNVGVFPAKLEKSAEEAVLSPVSDQDSGVLIADLLAATGKREQAKTAYETLAKQYPGTSDISKSLGYLAWQTGDKESARTYFEAALQSATDPQMCYHLAMLDHEANQTDKVVIALRKALSLKPDYTDARLQLGYAELSLKNYPGAIASFVQIQKVTPDHAAALFNALAYAYTQTGDLESARKNLDNAKKWAKTDADTQRADELLRYVDAREAAVKRNNGTPPPVANASSANPDATPDTGAPTLRRAPGAETTTAAIEPPPPGERNPFIARGETVERVEGEAQTFECVSPHARLVVLVGTKTMTFEITDPNRIMLKHAGADTFNFNCGPMKFHMAVEYVPDAKPGSGLAGSVRKLEF